MYMHEGKYMQRVLLDLFPFEWVEVQHPQVLVVVKLLSIRGGKLPTKQPQLTPSLGYHHCLSEETQLNISKKLMLHREAR